VTDPNYPSLDVPRSTISKRWLFWLAFAVGLLVFLFLIRSILLPFVLGVFTAYFLDPAADKLEKMGISRGVATLLITFGFFLTVILASLVIIPVIASQFAGLISAIPGYIADFETQYASEITQKLGGLTFIDMEQLRSTTSNISGFAVKLAGNFVTGLLQSGMAIVNLLSLILITPIVAFYLLRDWDHITTRLDSYLPRSEANTIREQLAIIDRTLAGFLRGQINVCLILGTFYAVGLSLVGLKFGILIGLATGLLVIFPYVGLMLGMGTGLAVAFFQFDSIEPVFTVLGVFVIGQIMEGYFITPKLVGEKVGLHPVWIIFGMLAGATLFGFVGILLAVPVTAVIGVLIRFALQRYLESPYYQDTPPARKA
jgi:predicted PurR-regulated permease PerM